MEINHREAQRKHDHLCDLVAQRFKEMGLITHQFVKYKDRGREGEIDVLGFNDKYLLLGEVKCSDKKLFKGEAQLYRAADHYDTRRQDRRIFKFLVYNNAYDETIYEWVK